MGFYYLMSDFGFYCGGSVMGGSYQQGWDDCLDAVLTILDKAKSLREARRKIKDVQVLVKAKKFEQIRNELGVVGDLF
jgi:hypothetical protein